MRGHVVGRDWCDVADSAYTLVLVLVKCQVKSHLDMSHVIRFEGEIKLPVLK